MDFRIETGLSDGTLLPAILILGVGIVWAFRPLWRKGREEKTSVTAAVWGSTTFRFLAALGIFLLISEPILVFRRAEPKTILFLSETPSEGVSADLLAVLKNRTKKSEETTAPIDVETFSAAEKEEFAPLPFSENVNHRFGAIFLVSDGRNRRGGVVEMARRFSRLESTASQPVFTAAIKSESLPDAPISVLLIDSTPRYEFRWLRETLRREKNVRLSTLLLSADRRQIEADPLAIDAASLEAERLAEFDVIVLGDVDPKEIGPLFAERLRGVVLSRRETTSLWLIPGDRFLAAQADSPNPMADLLPGEPVQTAENADASSVPLSKIRLSARFREAILQYPTFDPTLEVTRIYPRRIGRVESEIWGTAENRPVFLFVPLGSGGIFWQGTDEIWRFSDLFSEKDDPNRCRNFYRDYLLGVLGRLAGREEYLPSNGENGGENGAETEKRSKSDRANLDFLRTLAEESGGEFYDWTEIPASDPRSEEIFAAANAVFSTLADQKPIVSEFDRRPLLSPVILLPLILLTLAGAWRLERQARKNRGEKIKKS